MKILFECVDAATILLRNMLYMSWYFFYRCEKGKINSFTKQYQINESEKELKRKKEEWKRVQTLLFDINLHVHHAHDKIPKSKFKWLILHNEKFWREEKWKYEKRNHDLSPNSDVWQQPSENCFKIIKWQQFCWTALDIQLGFLTFHVVTFLI